MFLENNENTIYSNKHFKLKHFKTTKYLSTVFRKEHWGIVNTDLVSGSVTTVAHIRKPNIDDTKKSNTG